MRSKPCLIAAKRLSMMGVVLGVGEDVGPVIFMGSRTVRRQTKRVDVIVGPGLARLDIIGDRSIAAADLPIFPANRGGTLRLDDTICVRTTPGHNTDTPIFRGASAVRSPSDRATTQYLLTSYCGLPPAISPTSAAALRKGGKPASTILR